MASFSSIEFRILLKLLNFALAALQIFEIYRSNISFLAMVNGRGVTEFGDFILMFVFLDNKVYVLQVK